jgi:hypothetical protein
MARSLLLQVQFHSRGGPRCSASRQKQQQMRPFRQRSRNRRGPIGWRTTIISGRYSIQTFRPIPALTRVQPSSRPPRRSVAPMMRPQAAIRRNHASPRTRDRTAARRTSPREPIRTIATRAPNKLPMQRAPEMPASTPIRTSGPGQNSVNPRTAARNQLKSRLPKKILQWIRPPQRRTMERR